MARRLRLLIYEGDAEWIAPHKNEFIKPDRPYHCGKGIICVTELHNPDELAKNDRFRECSKHLALIADELIEHERRKYEEFSRDCDGMDGREK